MENESKLTETKKRGGLREGVLRSLVTERCFQD